MKIKTVLGGILLVLFSTFFISAAPADGCSVEDPCQTYAVMEDNKVVNIIVCQPSVCGSGFFNNQRVVPQVAADSSGQNRGGYWGTESNGTFTISQGPSVNIKEKVINDVDVSVTMHGEIKSTSRFEDTVNKPTADWFTPVQLPVDTKVEISAGDETMIFNTRLLEEEFNLEVWLSELELLFKNIDFFNITLFSWGWFL